MTYKEQLADPRWQRKRLQILERDKFTCQYCLDTTTQLQVHHRRYDKTFQTLAWEYPNHVYQTLCKDCHKAISEHIEEYGNVGEFATLRIKHNDMPDRLIVYSNGKVIIPIEHDVNNLYLYDYDAQKIVQFLINHWLKNDL